MIRLFILAAVFCVGCGSGRIGELERELVVEREKGVMLNNRLYRCEKRLSLAGKVCSERVSKAVRGLGVCVSEREILLGEKSELERSWRRCEREGVDLRKRFESGCEK